MTSARDIEVLAGLAGTGKSVAVAAANDAWDASGYRVRGAALSGIAAENLEKSSGVESRTLASWELAWKNGREEVFSRDVFVIDEAEWSAAGRWPGFSRSFTKREPRRF